MIRYPLATNTWDDEELKAIKSVMDSNRYTMAEHVNSFENDFGKFINRKYCVMVSSGSAANLLSIASLFYTKKPMLKRGDEIIVPAVSWSTTYFPLQQFGSFYGQWGNLFIWFAIGFALSQVQKSPKHDNIQ